MVGEDDADSYTWTASDTYSTSNYANEDSGAWTSLKSAYGIFTSCRNDNDTTNNYTPCNLTYGADDLGQYSNQGGAYRSGQCKAFTNLAAYRSGVYHGLNWAFVSLPTDANTAAPQDPLSTTSTVQAGDILRRTGASPHAVIITRVVGGSPFEIVVVDSNWNAGEERVKRRVMNYSASGISDPGTYNTYDCVYTSTTGDGC